MPTVSRLPGIELAYEFLPGKAPVVVFCPGYASDMTGSKALALEAWCQEQGQAMLRFDYSGHGRSGGVFLENGIGDWAADAAFVLAQIVPTQEVLLVGSSMGGWISLLLGPQLGARLKAMVLIAPAPDFTAGLVERELTPEQRATLERDGVVYTPSAYGAPLPLSRALIERSATHLVMHQTIPLICPIRILHGMCDESVPWQASLKLVETLASADVRLIYVKNGDHRLSSPAELALLTQTISTLLTDTANEVDAIQHQKY